MPLLYKTEYFVKQLRAAADFYDVNAGYAVADAFLSAVETAMEKIAENPARAPRYLPPEGWHELEHLHYRMLNLEAFSPFPYTVYYEIEREEIILHALYHHSRNREQLLSEH